MINKTILEDSAFSEFDKLYRTLISLRYIAIDQKLINTILIRSEVHSMKKDSINL